MHAPKSPYIPLEGQRSTHHSFTKDPVGNTVNAMPMQLIAFIFGCITVEYSSIVLINYNFVFISSVKGAVCDF